MNLYNIEALTKDGQGYVYWKGIQIEHYSFTDKGREKIAAENLASDCRLLESDGIDVSTSALSFLWQKRELDKFPSSVRQAAQKIAGSYGIKGICDAPYIANLIMEAIEPINAEDK